MKQLCEESTSNEPIKEPAVGGQGCEVVETEREPGDQGEDQGWHQQPVQAIRDVVMRLEQVILN